MKLWRFLAVVFVCGLVLVYVPIPIGTKSAQAQYAHLDREILDVSRPQYLVPRKLVWAGWPLNDKFGWHNDPKFTAFDPTSIMMSPAAGADRITVQGFFVNAPARDHGGVTELFLAMEDNQILTEHPIPVGGALAGFDVLGVIPEFEAIAVWDDRVLLVAPWFSYAEGITQVFAEIPRNQDGVAVQLTPRFESKAWDAKLEMLSSAPLKDFETLCRDDIAANQKFLRDIGEQKCLNERP